MARWKPRQRFLRAWHKTRPPIFGFSDTIAFRGEVTALCYEFSLVQVKSLVRACKRHCPLGYPAAHTPHTARAASMDLVQVTDAVDLRGCVAVSLLAVVALLWLERRCTSSLQPLRWRHAASVGKALCLAYSTANAAVVAYILPKMIMWGHFTSVHQASCVRLDAPAARTMFAVYLLSKVRLRGWLPREQSLRTNLTSAPHSLTPGVRVL